MVEKAPLPKSIVDALPASIEIFKYLHAANQLIQQSLIEQLAEAERGGAVNLARAFVALHRLHDHVEAFEKAFSKVFERYKTDRVPGALEDEGTKNVPLVESFRVQTGVRLYVSVRSGMLPEAIEFCEATNNLRDIVARTINANTLASAVGEQMRETSIEPPRRIFALSYKSTAKVVAIKSRTSKMTGDDIGEETDD